MLAMLFVLLPHTAPAPADENRHPSSAGGTAEPAIESSGLRVHRDPISDRLGPPPAGVAPPGLSIAEQQTLNRSDRGLRARSLPNGAVAIDLQGRFSSMAVASTDTRGQPAVNCALTPKEANAALRSAVSTPGR
mgnify:FL=1